MGRPDKDEKQRRKAHERLQTLLARGRTAEAMDAWLSVPAKDREELPGALLAAIWADLERATRKRDHTSAIAWLTRVLREPQLLDVGRAPAQARWQLLNAALRARRWPAAARLWTDLRPHFSQGELSSVLDAIVETQGTAPTQVLRKLLDRDAERLGLDAPRPRTSYPDPVNVEQARTSCMACFGCEPFSRFRDVVDGWLGRVPADVAQALRVVAVQLSHRELASNDEGGAVLVAGMCARWALEASAPPELEETLSLALRAVARACAAEVRDERVANAFQNAVEAALRYPALRGLVGPLVLTARFSEGFARRRLASAQAVLAAESSPALTLLAAELLHDAAGDDHVHEPGPTWFAQAVEAALSTPGSVLAHLQRPDADAARLLHCLLASVTIPLAVRVLDELWPGADESMRELLASSTAELVERMHEESDESAHQPSRELYDLLRETIAAVDPSAGSMPDSMLRQFLRSEHGRRLAREFGPLSDGAKSLPKSMRPLWQRLQDKVVAYDVTLLETALELEPRPKPRAELARRFWGRRNTLAARVRALIGAHERDCSHALKTLRTQLLTGLTPTPADAADAFRLADQPGAPPRLRRPLAQALVAAVEREAAPFEPEPRVGRALLRARYLLAPARTSAKKKATRSAAPRARRNSRQSAQLAWNEVASRPGGVP